MEAGLRDIGLIEQEFPLCGITLVFLCRAVILFRAVTRVLTGLGGRHERRVGEVPTDSIAWTMQKHSTRRSKIDRFDGMA